MRQIQLFFAGLCCVACVPPLFAQTTLAQEPAPDWELITEHAEWQPRDSQGEMALGDKLFLIGGWFDSYSEGPRDIWSSTDGAHWERIVEQAPFRHADLSMSITFKDRIWMMGGWHLGRLDDATASNEVWSSADGVNWDCVTDEAAWSARQAAGLTVFNDELWLLGGVQKYYFGTQEDLRNDVWRSADGATWECVTEQAPWAPRAYHQVVAHDGKLWVMGGGNYLPTYEARNDVWCSSDGKNWECVCESAPWSPRLWFSATVYRGRMWVLGGWSNNPSQNWGDVWHSVDGRTWEKLETKTMWKERHEHSVWVFQDALWVGGGMNPPLCNNVWRLHLPENWPSE